MRPYLNAILGLLFLVSSCRYLPLAQQKHEDFMSKSDCLIYKNEVQTENFPFGRVEYIDTNVASGCVKQQLSKVYLLYHDSICVAIYNQHPKDNILLIERLIKKYQSDTSRLTDFIKFDDGIRITISRLCKDKSDVHYFEKYVDWRNIELAEQKSQLSQTKDELITTWYNWTD